MEKQIRFFPVTKMDATIPAARSKSMTERLPAYVQEAALLYRSSLERIRLYPLKQRKREG